MKTGDKVIITDGSYTLSVVNGEVKHELLNYGIEKGKQYTVIAVGCVLPAESCRYVPYYPNDTVIQADDSGKVVFIHNKFLAPAKHTIQLDGKQMSISYKSYKSIKRSLCL